MPCLFAVFEICHRSHSPLCSLFQIPKPTKIQVKIAQLILSPLSRRSKLVYIELSYYFVPTAVLKKERSGDERQL